MGKDSKNETRKKDIERVKQFRLLDDIFMKVVLKDNIEAVQLIVRIVLGRDDIEVIEVKTQEELTNLYGHSVRLDVLARDSTGKLFNLEIQRDANGAGEKRARYHLGTVDTLNLPAGSDYEQLNETYIIFITEKDFFSQGLPIYTIERIIQETGETFNDGSHILYVNGAFVGENEIGKLMADFREKDPKKMYYKPLADKVWYFKSTEGGLDSVCKIIEEVRNEGIQIGIEQGIEQGIERGIEQGSMLARKQMIEALLKFNTETSLLNAEQFKGLQITQEEIIAARTRMKN